MKIPLILKLKKQAHKDIAEAQDIIIKELYNIFDNAILHGGTAIWRCYEGNRFSEDIDVYIPKTKKLDILFDNLKRKGFVIHKKKITKNSLYSNLELNRIFVRFEALFKTTKRILKEFETAKGNYITIYTLSPENIIKEKVSTYLKRRKIRDIYDIFFLLRYVQNKKEVSKELNNLIKNFEEPIDKKDLKVLIIQGLVPDSKEMLEYIERWGKRNI